MLEIDKFRFRIAESWSKIHKLDCRKLIIPHIFRDLKQTHTHTMGAPILKLLNESLKFWHDSKMLFLHWAEKVFRLTG